MSKFFTSDQHYFHNNVIKYCNRPFNSVEEMNEELIRRHNSVVKPEDDVYHLGDFSLAKRAPEQILHRLNGIHWLKAVGNHDWCHPVHAKNPSKLEKFQKLYLDAGFKTLDLESIEIIDSKQVLMSHFPYYDPNPEFDQRYPDYRPKDEGRTLLHGHVHCHWLTKFSPKGTLMINVGVDVWDYYPAKLEDIQDLIKDPKQAL